MAAPNFVEMQPELPRGQPGTLLWQGGWDHTDSGVQSGATTRGAPSVRSMNTRAVDESDWHNANYGQMDSNQLEQQLVQTRDERIREAMFGESLDPSMLGTLFSKMNAAGGSFQSDY